MKGGTLIEIESLSKSFGRINVLRDISLTVALGEKLVIVGASGSGKTTLLDLMAGQTRPDSGKILIDGRDIGRMSEREKDGYRKSIGIAFQMGGLLGSLSLADNVALPLRYHTELPETLIRTIVRLKLQLVELREWARSFPHELSGGMLKRAGIAWALAMEPRVLFYDEPTAGLDAVTAAHINELMLKLNEGLGVTSVVVTHSLETARRVADRIVLLDGGRVAAEGSPKELWASRDPLVEQFLHGRSRGPMTERIDLAGYYEDLLTLDG